jgi:GPI mannosyltransferase 2
MPLLDSDRPRLALTRAFVAWKSLLLLIAAGGSLGPPYDTSTTLIQSQPRPTTFWESPLELATRLTRWDAIYFVQSARRGYVYEQEWAFGRGLPTIIGWIVQGT